QPSKGCHTWGHTYLEALANIREAIELYVEDLLEAGEAIPVDPEPGAGEKFRNGLTDVSRCTLIRNRLEPHDEVRHASEPRVRDVARSALRCLNPSRWFGTGGAQVIHPDLVRVDVRRYHDFIQRRFKPARDPLTKCLCCPDV